MPEPRRRYTLQTSVELDSKDAQRIKKLLVRTEERGCTPAEAETAHKKLLELLTKLELTLDDIALVEVVPKSKVKPRKEFDFVLDPPIRSGMLYDEAKNKHLIGRYIYLQEGDQELLDSFCRSWLNTYEKDKNFFLCLDLETHGLNPVLEDNEILLHCLSWDGENGIVFEHQKFNLDLYKEVLNTIPLANHNIKFDIKWLIYHLQVNPIILWDTMVCAQIGWAGIFPDYMGKKYSLDNVVMQLMDPLRISKLVRKDFYTKRAGTGFTRAQVEYAVRDAILTYRLVKLQYIRLSNFNLLSLWEDVELPLLKMMIQTELKGIPVNVETAFDLLKAKEAELIDRRDEIGKLIMALPDKVRPKPGPGGFYNPMSCKQLPKILAAIDVRVVNTEAKTLEMARADHADKELLIKIIEYRNLANQIGKLLKKLCTQHIDLRTRRIYPTNNTCGAETGRLSVQDPPLHQIQEWARPIIEAEPGWVLLGRDYSQYEFRACAARSGEPKLLKLFEDRAKLLPTVKTLVRSVGWDDPDEFCKKLFSHKEKDLKAMEPVRAKLSDTDIAILREFTRLDIHRSNAASVFGKEPDEVTAGERSVCKTLGYAVLYGAGIPQIRSQLAADGYIYSAEECKKFYDAFFENLPRVKKFVEETHKKIKNDAWIETHLGRKRFFKLPERWRTREYAKAKADAERESVNYYFQASNADATKRSMITLWEEWQDKYEPKIQPVTIVNVHDELVTMCLEELADEVDARKEQIMVDWGGAAIDYKCPIEVSGMRMRSWRK